MQVSETTALPKQGSGPMHLCLCCVVNVGVGSREDRSSWHSSTWTVALPLPHTRGTAVKENKRRLLQMSAFFLFAQTGGLLGVTVLGLRAETGVRACMRACVPACLPGHGTKVNVDWQGRRE